MISKSKVSIIVPCYNQESFLSDTLSSVFLQTYPIWECIIINDGSTDNSENIALEWVGKDPRFKYYSIENGGVSKARNFGIKHSDGIYILPLDGDDKISPNYIEESVKVMDGDKSIQLVYTDAQLFGEKTGKWSFGDYNYTRLLHINMICSTALFFKRDYDKTTGYNENMKNGLEDWDFWISFLNPDSRVVKISNVKFYYRRKTMSRSKKISNKMNTQLKRQIYLNHLEIYTRYLPDIITLYNENLSLKKWSIIYNLKRIARFLFKAN